VKGQTKKSVASFLKPKSQCCEEWLLVTATTFAQKAILGFNNVNELHP